MITRIGRGVYRVEHEGRSELVYVAGPPDDRWIFWNGQVFRQDARHDDDAGTPASGRLPGAGRRPAPSIAAPMPARVSRILARTGATVERGDTLIVLEAMKMELPLRSSIDAVVAAVHCEEGELVQADAVLMDLQPR